MDIIVSDEIQGLLKSTNELAKETFKNEDNIKEFLTTLSKLYNVSYNNILLLKKQRGELKLVASKEKLKKEGINIRENEKPLKIIKAIRSREKLEFKLKEVYDISQTDAQKANENLYSKEVINLILKGMCDRRKILFNRESTRKNIENIIIDIRNNVGKSINKNGEDQAQVENLCATFGIIKNLKLNTRNYNLAEVCIWGNDKTDKELKNSLKNIQKLVNYFVSDFKSQEKINNNVKINNEEEFE